MSVSITPSPDRPKRRLRWGLTVSIILHSCLVFALVVIPYRIYVLRTSGQGQAAGTASPGGTSDKVEPAPNAPTPESAAKAEKVMADKAEFEFQAAVAKAETLSDDEKLRELEKLTNKLDRVASEKSVEEMSQKLKAWLKTEERATAPAEKPPEGDFDYGTAQFHDVKREELPEGGYRYKSVLLDAAGRTVEVEIDAAEGESTYRALALVKSSPFAEKLYRSITMPLLDKLTKAAEQAATPAAEATPSPAEPIESSPANKD